MRIFDGAHYEYYESDSLVRASVFVLMVAVVAFLLDMLVAQLTCANEAVYSDKIEYVSLERIAIIVSGIPVVSQKRKRIIC